MSRYFYTKKIELIDFSEIDSTYIAANKYLAFGLIKDLLENSLKISNVCLAYDQLAKLEIGDSLIRDFKHRITAWFSEACASDSFTQIGQDTLVCILKFDVLNISELDLLKACMRWTDNEVAKRHSEADQASK